MFWLYHKLVSCFLFLLLQIILLWAFLHISFGGLMCRFLLDMHLGIEILDSGLLYMLFHRYWKASQSESTNLYSYQQCFYFLSFSVVHAKSFQLCLTLCNPVDCSPPGSSVHGILQARILEWGAMPDSRGFSRPRNQTSISCICRWILYPLSHMGNPWNALPTEK